MCTATRESWRRANAASVEAGYAGTTKVTTAEAAELATTETAAAVSSTKAASTKMSAASTAVRVCPRCRSESYKSGDCYAE